MKPTDFALQMPTSPADIDNHRHPSQATTIAAAQSQPLSRNLYDRSLSSEQVYQQELQRQQQRQFGAHPLSKGLQTDIQTLYMQRLHDTPRQQRLKRDLRQELRQTQEQLSEQGQQQQHQQQQHQQQQHQQQQHQQQQHQQQQKRQQQQQQPQQQQRQQQRQQHQQQQQQQPQQQHHHQQQHQQHHHNHHHQEAAEIDHCGYNIHGKSHLPHEHHPPPVATDFCAPNLYRVSLQLTAELEIGRWWDNVIDIFTSSYCATRLLLSVPHDLTDTVNTPWGAKAIYNKDSCHSASASCQDSIPDSCSLTSSSSDNSHLLFDTLQPFDCDMDPLVDNKGILKILQRGKIVIVSREYHHPGEHRSTSRRSWNSAPNTPQQMDDTATQLRTVSRQTGTPGADPPWSRTLDTPCLNEMEEGHCSYFTHREGMHCHLPNHHHHHHHGEATRICDYEDFEQQQPSPWSQSPAPSPAVIDLNVNPFFQSMPEIDEDAFEPAAATPSTYASANFSYPAVTDKNVYSIVHIPLIHPTTARNVAPTNAQHSPVPIAILSFLSCVVPYPAHLLQSLHSLAPFLATTLSVASIHEQTVKQSSIHTASLRNTRQKRRRTSGMTTTSAPETGLAGEGEETDSTSSDEASSTSSRWEYATVFSANNRLDGTAGSNREDRITSQQSPDSPGSNCGDHEDDDDDDDDNDDNDDDDDDNDNDDDEDDEDDEEEENCDDEFQESDDDDLTADFPPLIPQPGKQGRVSTARMRSHHRPKRKSIGGSPRTSSLMCRPPSAASNLDGRPRVMTPSTKMLRLILDVMPNAVYTCSRSTGECTWVNKRYLQYTGLHIEDLLESKWIDTIHKDDQQRVITAWKTAFERGEGFSGQYRIRRFDGKYRWFLGRAGPLRDARGGIIYWFGTCTDVHDQKIAEEQQSRQLRIEANEKKYRLLAEAIPQIVFTATPNDGITYVNAKWTKYSSQTPEQACGLGFLSHVHPDDRQCCVLPEVTDTAGEVAPHPTEVRLMQADGSFRWFLVKCISVEVSEQGRKWFGTCTDINKHKLLEQKLKEAHDAAQRSTESKTRFLSNMSHEIRTPLIGITGMINFMLDTNLTEEQLDFAHTIQQSADALLMVINDILDLSKVEAGMMKLAMEPFSCLTMIEDANELLSTLAIQKGLELSFIVEDEVPDVICGDRIRLRQVLLNVIGNAIKFTNVGEIFSRCSVQSMDSEKHEIVLLFEVVDTGDGFSPKEEALIFRPFSQANSSHGGSGLGLVISRQLIELHGGTMSCKSKKGDGSTFYFTAKFTVPPETTQPGPQTPTAEVSDSPFFRYSRAAVQSSRRPEGQSKDLSPPSPPLPPPSSSSSSSSSSTSSSSSAASFMSLRDSRYASTLDTTFARISPASSPETSNETLSATFETPPVSQSRPATPTIGSRPTTPSFKARKPVRIELPRPLRILLVAELVHARETLIHYVCSTLPREPVSDIDVCESYLDANSRLLQPDVKPYTHVLVNLQQQTQVIALASTIKNVRKLADTICVVLSTPIQRFGIVEGAQGNLPARTDYIIKPLNRSKMEGLFDTSTTVRENFLKRRNTRQIVASQQEVFKRMAADVGNKGHRVLLVEDNFVNQKVMAQYLYRVGIEVTVASNGKQCLQEFYKRPHDYFNVILCDLFMPIKDGYETTKEIRAWEADNLQPDEPVIPIIALSANVMADVVERCREAGFTNYISKPVDFATLSDVLRTVLNDEQVPQK